jgi:quercetin dioxygenase-like cupin family protein
MTDYALTSHEHVTVIARSPEAIEVTVTYAASGAPPPKHLHPAQDERFEVLDGQLTVRLGSDAPRQLAAGDTFEIPRGTVHRMWNPTSEPARARWTTSPAGRTDEWLALLDALSAAGKALDLRTLARPLVDYRDTFRLAVAPDWLLAPALRVAAAVLGRAR